MSNSSDLARETLKHRLEALPDKVKPHVRMGFHLLARATAAQRASFVTYLLDITQKGDILDRDHATKLVGIDSGAINDALSTVAMVIGATVESDVSADDFVELGRGSVFDDAEQEVAREIVSLIIGRRKPLKAGMKDSALANSVLPSFQGIWIEIDVRLRFDDEHPKISGGVAVAVCNLKTDCTDDFWFQMNASDVDYLIERLEKISTRLKAADALAQTVIS